MIIIIMIEHRHLEQLLTLDRVGTFRAAAGELGISQPALSRSIQSLEAQLGVTLFERRRPRVLPTPAGRLLLERAREVAGSFRRLEQDLDRYLGRETGELVAGIGTYPAEFILPQTLRAFMAAHPGVRIHLSIETWTDLLPRLRDGRIELAVISTDDLEPGAALSIRPLRPREGVVFARAGHPLAALDEPTLEDLRAYPVACPRLPQALARLLGRPVEPEIECNSISTIKAIVGESDALGIVAPESLADAPERWRILPPGRGRLHASFGIVTRTGRTLTPAAEAFIDRLIAADAPA